MVLIHPQAVPGRRMGGRLSHTLPLLVSNGLLCRESCAQTVPITADPSENSASAREIDQSHVVETPTMYFIKQQTKAGIKNLTGIQVAEINIH